MVVKDLLKERAQLDPQAAERARERANASRWNLETAVFLFAIMLLTLILLFEGVGTAIVAPVAFFGLVMVWFVGWRQGKQLRVRFYIEELYMSDQNPI